MTQPAESTQTPSHARPSTELVGLSQSEAQRRLRQEGPNELPRPASHGFVHTALEVVREPMILLLLAAGVV